MTDDELLKEAFQSLFSWNSPSDIGPAIKVLEMLKVSILVFVELALGQ